ncbi:ependymin-like [Nematolebias whitei]|uniref:ependymin-like n=1 Tax=Nematolebias whitei TaxID=451745 RepID=UPI00189B1F8A|nr:ependymin-like [Nematolebias whitei]
MRALVLLVCLVVGCLAQIHHPCSSPTLMTGSFLLASQKGLQTVYANYTYDAVGERIRLQEVGDYNNETFQFDAILLYKQGIMYKLNYKNSTCSKAYLDTHFHPLMIPKNASFRGQAVLGSSIGQGVLVNTWAGELNLGNTAVKYVSIVTDIGCLPICSVFNTDKSDWVATSFFNVVVGIADPQLLIPPPFCNGAQLEKKNEDEEDLISFFSLF